MQILGYWKSWENRLEEFYKQWLDESHDDDYSSEIEQKLHYPIDILQKLLHSCKLIERLKQKIR